MNTEISYIISAQCILKYQENCWLHHVVNYLLQLRQSNEVGQFFNGVASIRGPFRLFTFCYYVNNTIVRFAEKTTKLTDELYTCFHKIQMVFLQILTIFCFFTCHFY